MDALVKRLGLYEIRNSFIALPGAGDRRGISGGERKRTTVASELIVDPRILAADEPTTGLDPITTEMVDDLIVEAEQMFGVTSIVISHDMASVVRIADYLSFLHLGEIAASGTREQLLHSEHPATAEFVRASRISVE